MRNARLEEAQTGIKIAGYAKDFDPALTEYVQRKKFPPVSEGWGWWRWGWPLSLQKCVDS